MEGLIEIILFLGFFILCGLAAGSKKKPDSQKKPGTQTVTRSAPQVRQTAPEPQEGEEEPSHVHSLREAAMVPPADDDTEGMGTEGTEEDSTEGEDSPEHVHSLENPAPLAPGQPPVSGISAPYSTETPVQVMPEFSDSQALVQAFVMQEILKRPGERRR